YNQDVLQQLDENGKNTGNFSHILRVFLIDPENKIRNIYSVAFLHPDIIINDVKTLLMAKKIMSEQGITEKGITEKDKKESDIAYIQQNAQTQSQEKKKNIHLGPGDHKVNYHSENYQTRSVSLNSRTGVSANLLKLSKNPPLGLPKVPVPANNAITEEKIQLGKKLFFDRRLSLNNTISCAMCHIPEQGFTNNELKTPAGFEGRTVRRNAPTIYNTAYLQKFHHDGRETSLENQIWQPLMASNEMAMPSIGMVVNKIINLNDYKGLFEQAFNGEKANVVTIGQAIASYERTLISANSAFDRWHFANEENAISESAKRGFNLFKGKAQCIACHTVEKNHALFTDNKLHNTGIGWERSMRKTPATKQVQVAPGQYVTVKQSIIKSVSHGPIGDLGLYEITQNPADRWKYRTPSLRNLTLTAPYMHNGALSTLTDVVSFYNKGGFKNKTQSPLIKPLNLTKKESDDLVTFLKTLTGSNVETLVSDAFATPIGDTH
ncbi:MAG: c-type cytochrome, partial [Alteromonadaceae bacterium]|nr:c-type cytochrome [Alteromonadaceae bacterium]